MNEIAYHEIAGSALRKVPATHTSPKLTARAGLADIITRHTQTFLWLQRYDEGLITDPKGHPGVILPTRQEATTAIAGLKADLVAKGQAGDLFVRERKDGLAALSHLVAESKPADKYVLIRPIMNMLAVEGA